MVCDILQRNRIAEIFIYIGDHFADPGERLPVPCVYIPGCGPRRKMPDQQGKRLHDDPFGLHLECGRVFDIQPGELLHLFAQDQIFREFLIFNIIRQASDLVQIDVGQIFLHIFSGNMDTEEHGCIPVRVSAVHLPRVNDDQMLVGNVVFPAFNLDICLAVQLIEQFDLLVPVQRMVTPGVVW